MDSDTCSRSMVAMLGLDTIGASRTGGLDTPMVPPQRLPAVQATRAQLKKDDRLPIIRNSRQDQRGEGCTRRAATSAASGGACVSRLAARGGAAPFSGST